MNPRPTFDDALKIGRNELNLNSITLKRNTGEKWWSRFRSGDISLEYKLSVVSVEFRKFLKIILFTFNSIQLILAESDDNIEDDEPTEELTQVGADDEENEEEAVGNELLATVFTHVFAI